MEDQTAEEPKLQSGVEEEENPRDSSCMVELKLRSVQEDAPAPNKRPVSRKPRKKSLKKVAYDNDLAKKGSKRKRGRFHSEAHKLALKNAKELQTKLPSEHPSFVKQIQRSHVTRFYKMGIPADFCRPNLPTHNTEVILEDENGESYTVKFLPGTEGAAFVGGWKRFAIEHSLLEGDVVILQLLKHCYFKVYIVRASDPTAAGSANLAIVIAPSNEGKKKRKRKAANSKGLRVVEPLNAIPENGRTSPVLSDSVLAPLCIVPENGRMSPVLASTDLGPGPSSESGRDDLHSSSEASQLSGRDADFDNFKIIVNGLNIDSDLSRSTRMKYYKLCCTRESYLHENLLKNVDRELAVGLITGTLSVADEIRACKLCTSKDDFVMWRRCLDGFKNFGMDVDFLRERLERLATVGSELRGKEEVKKYIEVKNKRGRMQEEMKSHEMKLLELKQAEEKVKDEMKNMKINILKHKDAYQVEASAPW